MPLNGLRFFLGHRFEFTLIKGKLQIVLNDSLMYQSENNYLDLRLLNPLFFLHNGFMAGNSNSLASLEVEYSPVRYLSLYGQFALDDYGTGFSNATSLIPQTGWGQCLVSGDTSQQEIMDYGMEMQSLFIPLHICITGQWKMNLLTKKNCILFHQ